MRADSHIDNRTDDENKYLKDIFQDANVIFGSGREVSACIRNLYQTASKTFLSTMAVQHINLSAPLLKQ